MIKGYKLKLGGATIEDIKEVSFSIETPHDNRGAYMQPTFAATISVVRDASKNAITDLFKMATNGDGRKKLIESGRIEFESFDKSETYAIEIKKAFISNWSLDNPTDPKAPTLESFELKVGDLEYQAAGGNAPLKIDNF